LKKQSGLPEAGQHHPEDGSSPASLARDASFLSLDFASLYFLSHHIQRMLNIASARINASGCG
jgi:hypothetical protein